MIQPLARIVVQAGSGHDGEEAGAGRNEPHHPSVGDTICRSLRQKKRWRTCCGRSTGRRSSSSARHPRRQRDADWRLFERGERGHLRARGPACEFRAVHAPRRADHPGPARLGRALCRDPHAGAALASGARHAGGRPTAVQSDDRLEKRARAPSLALRVRDGAFCGRLEPGPGASLWPARQGPLGRQGGTGMPNDTRSRGPVLDPIERASEAIFGVLMAVNITDRSALATAGRQEIRTMLIYGDRVQPRLGSDRCRDVPHRRGEREAPQGRPARAPSRRRTTGRSRIASLPMNCRNGLRGARRKAPWKRSERHWSQCRSRGAH